MDLSVSFLQLLNSISLLPTYLPTYNLWTYLPDNKGNKLLEYQLF